MSGVIPSDLAVEMMRMLLLVKAKKRTSLYSSGKPDGYEESFMMRVMVLPQRKDEEDVDTCNGAWTVNQVKVSPCPYHNMFRNVSVVVAADL